MLPKNQPNRILRAKNQNGAMAFYEACNVMEMETGAISLRMEAESLEAVSGLLKEADIRLSCYRLDKASYAQQQVADLSFH